MTEVRKPKIKAGEMPALKYAAYAAEELAKEGDGALETITEAQHELGKKYSKSQTKSLGIKGKDARAAGAVYVSLLQGLSVEHSIIKDTNKLFVVHTRDCPFFNMWKTKGADASKLCTGFGKSFVQGLCDGVNPRLKYSVTKMMSGEDMYCEERIDLS